MISRFTLKLVLKSVTKVMSSLGHTEKRVKHLSVVGLHDFHNAGCDSIRQERVGKSPFLRKTKVESGVSFVYLLSGKDCLSYNLGYGRNITKNQPYSFS